MLCYNCIHYEIERLEYPLRFLSEKYFVDRIVPKYLLDSLPEKYFYENDLFSRIKKYISSADYLLKFSNWYEKKRDFIIPIILATNEEMALSCGVTIQSIIENKSDNYFYDIYILYTNLSKNMKYKLETMRTGNVHITLISVEDCIQNKILPLASELPHITRETYYRFLIPSLFSYEKILYLDSDLIVQKDVAQLYNVELGNDLVAGVIDILSDKEEKDRVRIGLNPLYHINAGVLLINNKLWRDENIQGSCFHEIIWPSHSWTLNDQDIINFVCQDRILFLDNRWNFLYAAYHWKRQKYNLLEKNINPRKSFIIHYNGPIKPWNSTECELGDVWWKYAKRFPFYESILCKFIQVNLCDKKLNEKAAPIPHEIEKLTIDSEKIYSLKGAFVKKSLQYFFSYGKKRKAYRVELDLIMAKIRGMK